MHVIAKIEAIGGTLHSIFAVCEILYLRTTLDWKVWDRNFA